MNAAAIPDISIASFESGSIDAEAFDHEAHVYVGWLYLQQYPLPEAIERFSGALQRLTAQLGIPGKYHATITWFFMFLIAQRCDGSRGTDWFTFRRTHTDLFASGEDNVLKRYYSSEILGSDLARVSFILPDKLAA